MKTPDINLKEIEEMKKRNFKERLEFVEKYANWVRKSDNKTWSNAQKKIINKK